MADTTTIPAVYVHTNGGDWVLVEHGAMLGVDPQVMADFQAAAQESDWASWSGPDLWEGLDIMTAAEQIGRVIAHYEGPALVVDDEDRWAERIEFFGPRALLVGAAEAARILGWDRRKVSTYHGRGLLPKPVADLAATPVWRRQDIEDYATRGGKLVTCHKDGTVTYWSVYRQSWVRRARSVPDQEYAAMSEPERRQVDAHLKAPEE